MIGYSLQEMSSPFCNLLRNEDTAKGVKHLLIETDADKLTSLSKHNIPYPSWYHRDLNVFYHQSDKSDTIRDLFIYLAGSRKTGLRPLLIVSISDTTEYTDNPGFQGLKYVVC